MSDEIDETESRKADPEWLCVSRVIRMFAEHDTEAQDRMAEYIAARFRKKYPPLKEMP